MAFYGAVKLDDAFFDGKLKWGMVVPVEELLSINETFAFAVKTGTASGSASLPSFQIGGTFEEAKDIRIQVGGVWKDLA